MKMIISLLPWLLLLPAPLSGQKKDNDALRQEEAEDYFKKWLDQDVLLIIAEEEREVFQKLTTAEEKEQFIEQFWLRRDPDPRTSFNEFKEEHYRRIAYANERFTSGDPGWMTDRGRVYILHGQPDEIVSRPDGGAYVRPLEEGGGRTVVHPYEKWRYRFIEGIGQNVELEFVDKTNTGKYELAVHPWEKDALLHIGEGKTLAEEIGMARRADHPGLTPAAGGAAFGPQTYFYRMTDHPFARYERVARAQSVPIVKYKDLKQVVDAAVSYTNIPFDVRHDAFRLNEGQILVPITLQVSSTNLSFQEQGNRLMARVAVYGILTSMTGRVAAEFEDDFYVTHTADGLRQGVEKLALYQKMVMLEDRMRYRLSLVLKDLNGEKLGVSETAIIPPRYAEGELGASPLLLSSHVQTLERAPEQNEMFVLGDVKILPDLDQSFPPSLPLGVYFQVYNAAVDSSTLAPSLQVTYRLYQNGQLLKAATDEGGESMQYFSSQRIVLLKQLSLAGLEPGRYQIEVEVRDRLTDRKATLSEEFEVES